MRNPIITADLAEIASAEIDYSIFADKTVLVTGANGFLPAYLVETFLYLNETQKLGVKVIGLVRSRERADARFAHYRGRSDFELTYQNLYEPLTFAGKIDFIIHAASQASPKYYGVDPMGTLLPNTLGTYRLLEAAKAHGTQSLLYFSSSEVYGSVTDRNVMTENHFGALDCLQVRSSYAESKRMGETMVISWAKQHGLTVKVARPFHTYGPGIALNDGRVFSDFVADIVSGRNIIMKSDGSAVRAYCYLADATRAFLLLLAKGAANEAYNVGNSQAESSVIDLAETLVGLFPERNLKVERMLAPRGQDYLASPVSRIVPDTKKIEALGWRPRYSIAAGFRRTVESYQ